MKTEAELLLFSYLHKKLHRRPQKRIEGYKAVKQESTSEKTEPQQSLKIYVGSVPMYHFCLMIDFWYMYSIHKDKFMGSQFMMSLVI